MKIVDNRAAARNITFDDLDCGAVFQLGEAGTFDEVYMKVCSYETVGQSSAISLTDGGLVTPWDGNETVFAIDAELVLKKNK